MEPLPRPPAGYHASTLASLTEEPVPESTQVPQGLSFQSRSHESRGQTTPTLYDSYTLHSSITFTNVSNFSSPQGSRVNLVRPNQDYSRDSSRRPSLEVNSTAGSFYDLEKKLPEPPYHVFSDKKQKLLLLLASIAGVFSSLSSNIYFPALGIIANDVHVSLSTISFTVTVYMIVQGLAPSFWGPMSDTHGRRVTYIGTFCVYLAANIGLALSNNFASLMVFRGLQAAGSAATIAIGSGVIADIATPRQRGAFTGINSGIRMSGQSLGPVLGGIIAQFLNFHAIFWFLFIFGAITLIFIVLFLPETLRSIAGNGTIKLNSIHRPLIYKFSPPPDEVIDRNTPPKKKITLSTIVFPFNALKEKDVFIILIVGAAHYMVWSMVTSSTTALFEGRFNLNLLQLGLIFLPNGVGSTMGSLLTGKQSQREWDDAERAYRKEKNIPESISLNKKDLVDFPFEKARMGNMWWMVLIFVVSTALYGYSLKLNDDIVVPLILQFLIAYTQASIFNINQTLVVDLYPEASASASAINNLVRCLIGAGGVAAVQPMIEAIGAGPTFGILAGITAVVSLLLILEWYKGEGWRRARKERLAAEKQAKQQSDV